MNSGRLYTAIVVCYTIGFLGFLLPIYGAVYLLWYALLLLGTVLFVVRIVRGDD